MNTPRKDPDTPEARGGAAAVTAAAPRGRSRGALDRTRVLGSAVRFIDERGLRELTMRSLAADLGVEAMALYRYVHSREDLLDGVVETVVDELYGDPDVHIAPQDGWQDYLERLAHGVRRIALAHPRVFPLVATRPPAAPWVRPPLRSLRWVDSFLAALLSRGFTEDSAVAAYRAFSSFLLGHLLLEVSAMGIDTGPEQSDREQPATLQDLGSYAHVQRLEAQLSEDHAATEFEESLGDVLERLERLPRRRGGRRRRT